MKKNILIVEDEFIVANDLRMILEKAGHHICGIAPSVAKALAIIETKKPEWVLLDIFLKGDQTGIDLGKQLNDLNIPFIYISANTNQAVLEAVKSTKPYGFLVKPFREQDLLVMLDISQYHYHQNLKFTDEKESIFQKQIGLIINEEQSREEKLKQVAFVLQAVIPFDYLDIRKIDPIYTTEATVISKTSSNLYQVITEEKLLEMTSVSKRDAKSWKGTDVIVNETSVFNGNAFRQIRMNSEWLKKISTYFDLASAFIFRLKLAAEDYQISFYSSSADTYTNEHMAHSSHMEATFAAIIRNITLKKSQTEVFPVQEKLPEPVVTKPEIQEFYGIIGKSPLLLTLLAQVELISSSSISVLILGESGTGKERIAQTLHLLSPRKSKPMVTVNCGALPINLIESELFGHEAGAFTGANEKRIGKFEQADGGTIFMDEIGELSLDAQVKLLRVLQEKEIERLGSSQPKKVNVRVIAATNRNLEKEVAEGRFRLDLYYRLNVFPIELPPLRERPEDISLLAYHFLDNFNKKHKRKVIQITDRAMDSLLNYHWPGNIRELENLMEKSLLLAAGDEISEILIPQELPGYEPPAEQEELTVPVITLKTMEEMERSHIMSALTLCKGKIYGSGGAAEILNIPSTTLNSKIKKLGIKFEFIKD